MFIDNLMVQYKWRYTMKEYTIHFTTNPYATSYAKAPAAALLKAKAKADSNILLKTGNKAVIPASTILKWYADSAELLAAMNKAKTIRDNIFSLALETAQNTARSTGAKEQRLSLGLIEESVTSLNALATKALQDGNTTLAIEYAKRAAVLSV